MCAQCVPAHNSAYVEAREQYDVGSGINLRFLGLCGRWAISLALSCPFSQQYIDSPFPNQTHQWVALSLAEQYFALINL